MRPRSTKETTSNLSWKLQQIQKEGRDREARKPSSLITGKRSESDSPCEVAWQIWNRLFKIFNGEG